MPAELSPTTRSFLRNVPVLAELPDDLLRELGSRLTERHFDPGEWIIHEGEGADSMFILSSGRVEVVTEGPPETLLRVLRRGDVLGELALLTRGTRSASARARRETILLELGREDFERLILTEPPFALGLTRSLGKQLAQSRAPVASVQLPGTIAIVGLDPAAPADEVAALLERELARAGSVARLDEGALERIDQAERDADRVILRGGQPGEAWTDLLLREADLIVAVSGGGMAPARESRAQVLRGCELLVVGARPDGPLGRAVAARTKQVVLDRSALRDAVGALARRLTGRALGLVFSGGGARALAHIGVYEELAAAGLRIDRVAGVSAGSLLAAAVACDFTGEQIFQTMKRGFVDTNPTSDYVPPAFSLVRGAKTRRLLQAAFGERMIEELPHRFFALSCDLVGREAVLHREGRVVDAIVPSLSIPGVFPPVATEDGRLLVDGGVLDNLPVATMARAAEGPVIAVDVTGRMGDFRRPVRPRLERATRRARQALTGAEESIPRLGETLLRTLTVGSTDTVEAARRHADLVITPSIEGVGLMEWKRLSEVRELGRQAGRRALEDNRELLEALGA